MPAIPKGSLVLLTGASGFLAIHCAQELLLAGYKVRGTVRSNSKGDYVLNLLDTFAKKQGIESGFEYCIVQDVEKEQAFDEAVKGCDAVLHTASPFHFQANTDFVTPAVQGTLGCLRSAVKESKIKRIVITSSFAAMVNPEPIPYAFDEKDWNHFSINLLAEEKEKTDPFHAYRASKTLAEKAAWNFVESEKPNFDITTICPPLIFGPAIHQTSIESLNTSVNEWLGFLLGKKKDSDALVASSYADVRDVAKLHVQSLLVEEAGGKRFAVATGTLHYQKFLNILHDSELSKDFPNSTKGIKDGELSVGNTMNCNSAKKIFNWEPISMESTVLDMTRCIKERIAENWK